MKKIVSGLLVSILLLMGCNTATSSTASYSPSSQSYQKVDTKSSNVGTYTAPVKETTTLSNSNYYTNSNGNTVHSPAYASSVPAGASARCRDGTYSFSQSRRGTCSHHGGVAGWL